MWEETKAVVTILDFSGIYTYFSDFQDLTLSLISCSHPKL